MLPEIIATDKQAENLDVTPTRHPGRWLAVGIALLILGGIAVSVAHNPNMGWPVVWQYMGDPVILSGVAVTLELTLLCMVIATLLGTILAIMRLSTNRILLTVSGLYVWFFRGVPVLVQLIFWFNLGALFSTIRLGIPGAFTLFSESTNSIISGFTAALLGLGLYEAAYMAEVIRGGISSIDHGQTLAAQALGLPPRRIMRRIILPQAMRVIIPPTGNEIIGTLKNTSLVSVIAGAELLTKAQNIYSRTFEVIPLLIVATLWYLILTTVITVLLRRTELFYNKGKGGSVQSANDHRRVRDLFKYAWFTRDLQKVT